MLATALRVWDTLRADRSPRHVAGRLAVAIVMLAALWFCACAFMVLEPVT